MLKDSKKPRRFTLFFILLGAILVLISVANFFLNQKHIQEKFANTIYKTSQTKIIFEDLKLQIFIGALSGKKLELHVEKNNMRISLNQFRLHFNPFFFLIGKIKVNTVTAKEITIDSSHYQKSEEKKTAKFPEFLRRLKLERAKIDKIHWKQKEDQTLDIENLTVVSQFESLIEASPYSMTIANLKFLHPKIHAFVESFRQEGFFLFDFSQPRIFDESRISSTIELKNFFLSIEKRKKPWLTNAGWDADLNPILKKYYGEEIPKDRSYVFIPQLNFNLEKDLENTSLQNFYLILDQGILTAKGQYRQKQKNFVFELSTQKPVPISKLPLGQSQFRTAFEEAHLNLKLEGQVSSLQDHNLKLNLSGKLAKNLVHPEAGDLELNLSGQILDTHLNFEQLLLKLNEGELTANGSLGLKTTQIQSQFDFKNFDVVTVMRLFSTQDIGTTVSGSGKLSNKLTSPKIEITMASEDATYEFLHFGPSKADLLIENKNLKLQASNTSLETGQHNLDLAVQNVFNPFDQILHLKSTHENADIQALLKAESLSGKINGELDLNRKNALVTATGNFSAQDFHFFDKNLGTLKSKIDLKHKHLKVAPLTIEMKEPKVVLESQKGAEFNFDESGYQFSVNLIPELKIDGQFRKAQTDYLELDLKADNMPLQIFSAYLPVRPTRSSLTGQMNLKYHIYDPLLSQMQGKWQRFELETSEGALKLNKLTHLNFQNKAFTFHNFDVTAGKGRFTLDGSLGFSHHTNLKAKGLIDFSLLSDFNPFLSESDKAIDVDVTLKGDLAKPDLYGKINLQNDAVIFRNTPGDYEEINGTVFFDGNRIRFENLKFLYDDGLASLQGWIRTDYEKITAADLKFVGKEVPFHNAKGLNLLSDVNLALSGQGNLFLKGTIFIVDGQFNREFGIDNFTVAPVVLEEEGDGFGFLPSNTRLDLRIRNIGDFFMKNNIAELELNADFDAVGTLANPLLSGQIDVLSGEINAFGIDFEDATGYVQFRKRPGINPDIYLTATKESQEYEIYARIEGRLENMKMRLSSTPSLDRREILSILFYGQTPDQLVGERRSEFTQTAAITQLANVLSEPIYRVSGLDVVEVTSRQEASNLTVQRLSVGKTLGKRFHLTFTTDLGIEDPEQAFEMQYQVFDALYLTTAKDIGDRNRYRFDVTFRFEGD